MVSNCNVPSDSIAKADSNAILKARNAIILAADIELCQ
jgi:hypothetical protein